MALCDDVLEAVPRRIDDADHDLFEDEHHGMDAMSDMNIMPSCIDASVALDSVGQMDGHSCCAVYGPMGHTHTNCPCEKHAFFAAYTGQ